MILYPTETIYGIGVNPFDQAEMDRLFALKGRDERKVSAWLVRDVEDIAHYAELSETAAEIAKRFLPGPLTLVLPAKDTVPKSLQSEDGTIGFRISADPLAQSLIEKFWNQHQAPLTCTSANVSGLPAESTPEKIINQFIQHRPDFTGFDEVIDDGERSGSGSTVVSVIGNKITILRPGLITQEEIMLVR